ncbi:hypothetical protein [Palleronia sp. LCG004]|uniref:hypothetical protein n=1 Tax=Palleronia sp. LCG004 TaxID=3079304 RepID=UPI002941C49F|nr:hypothetical protein [Palleronia sp. LCG004]WOI55486.1 hypothetical protein RVY76_10570 [Palleronia sp. LCG004]
MMAQYHGTDTISCDTVTPIRSDLHTVGNRHASPATDRKRDFILLDGKITNVHHDRDFGRIEASVTFLMKCPGQPVRPVTIRTNVPVHGNRPLRRRLIEDADHLVDRIVISPVDLPRVA